MARRGKRKRSTNLEEIVEEKVGQIEETEEKQRTTIDQQLDDFVDSFEDYEDTNEQVDFDDLVVVEEEAQETIEEIIEQKETQQKAKKDINTFFEKQEDTKRLKKKVKEPKTKEKKKSKRQLKKEKEYEDIKDRKVFKYKGKKYTKVEDFIDYLNDHYLDIDEIAKEVLEDENFLGWLSKKSGTFSQSIKTFKQLKAEIEKE